LFLAQFLLVKIGAPMAMVLPSDEPVAAVPIVLIQPFVVRHAVQSGRRFAVLPDPVLRVPQQPQSDAKPLIAPVDREPVDVAGAGMVPFAPDRRIGPDDQVRADEIAVHLRQINFSPFIKKSPDFLQRQAFRSPLIDALRLKPFAEAFPQIQYSRRITGDGFPDDQLFSFAPSLHRSATLLRFELFTGQPAVFIIAPVFEASLVFLSPSFASTRGLRRGIVLLRGGWLFSNG